MAINLKEVLPALITISEQQVLISDKLQQLIDSLKGAPEPVEPTLRELLSPLRSEMDEMEQSLQQN